MFKRPTKRQLLVRRIITYTVMILAVVVIVAGTILFILGYRVDSDKGRLEQGALVQFDSKPNGADVAIDGKSINSNTPSKQTVVAGKHQFVVNKSGYETWSKTLNVKAGTLEWLDYLLLVPKNLQTESVANYASVYGEKASPDYKWLMVQEKADTPLFQLVDLRSQQVKSTTITLPTTLYSDATTEGVTHTFTMESWDQDGRYVIVKHTFNDKSEYIVVDTQDVATSINVSTLLSISLSELKFSGTSGSTLYGLTDGTIRKLDLSNATISRGLVSNVKNFNLFDTTVVTYTGTDPNNAAHQVAGIYREGDESSHVLRTINDLTTPLTIAATQYHSDDYVAISEGLKVTVLKGRYPASTDTTSASLKSYAELKVSSNVDTTQFSVDGDHLVVQSGLNFVSYEVEYMRETDSTIATTETTPHTLQWLDDAYLWAVYDGHLSIREFDGTNTHVIMTMEPGFDATLSQNGKYLYGIAKSGNGYQLQRVTMILN
ncbi:MAG: hypothetical protein JWN12_618 [Candidatus Saccharibacteria bacterium]|nr:hypothetical protein [Candidatus Saccharibacteria bacterium]